MRFPAFHKELLSQSYWNAGDDFGRIKLVISEGFAREHLAYPYERVKNVAAFSFQHAPLGKSCPPSSHNGPNVLSDILEQSNIAWPNQAMWRQVSLVGPYIAHSSPRKNSHNEEIHSHSPRRGSQSMQSQQPQEIGMAPLAFPRPVASSDPFTDQIHSAFNGWRQSSGNDVSMPDYASTGAYTRAFPSRQVTDPMSISEAEPSVIENNVDAVCDSMGTRPPANTPQNGAIDRSQQDIIIEVTHARKLSPRQGTASSRPSGEFSHLSDGVHENSTPGDATATITIQQAPTTIDGVKSRKENKPESPPVASQSSSLAKDESMRKVSQAFASVTNTNNKRQRIVTPAASKAIDDEDEPRSSPSTRKVSRTSAKECHGQKRVLSSITNNV